MCSTLTRRGRRPLRSKRWRAAQPTYVAKPTAQHGVRESMEALSRELLPKIRALFPSREHRSRAVMSHSLPARACPLSLFESSASIWSSLVVGVSTGGPAALEKLPARAPCGHFPLPILIVQHMPPLSLPRCWLSVSTEVCAGLSCAGASRWRCSPRGNGSLSGARRLAYADRLARPRIVTSEAHARRFVSSSIAALRWMFSSVLPRLCMEQAYLRRCAHWNGVGRVGRLSCHPCRRRKNSGSGPGDKRRLENAASGRQSRAGRSGSAAWSAGGRRSSVPQRDMPCQM